MMTLWIVLSIVGYLTVGVGTAKFNARNRANWNGLNTFGGIMFWWVWWLHDLGALLQKFITAPSKQQKAIYAENAKKVKESEDKERLRQLEIEDLKWRIQHKEIDSPVVFDVLSHLEHKADEIISSVRNENREDKCDYMYLENPTSRARSNGREMAAHQIKTAIETYRKNLQYAAEKEWADEAS